MHSLTLFVARITKLAGAALAVNEGLLRGTARPLVLATAALMIAGAEASRSLLLAVLDRLLGADPATPGDETP